MGETAGFELLPGHNDGVQRRQRCGPRGLWCGALLAGTLLVTMALSVGLTSAWPQLRPHNAGLDARTVVPLAVVAEVPLVEPSAPVSLNSRQDLDGHNYIFLAESNVWVCQRCGHVYETHSDGQGKSFEQMPPTWRCPVCGWVKEHFQLRNWVESVEPATVDYDVPG